MASDTVKRAMPYYDNPAGRLHDLLSRLSEQNADDSVLNGWAAVLGVGADDVVLQLGRVAELVRQTKDAADRANEPALIEPVAGNRAAWARPIFPVDQAFNKPLRGVLPGPEALGVLNLVSANLHRIAPEGEVPEDDRLDEIKSELRGVVDSIQAATDIPDDVKHLLIERLRDVEEAVHHLAIGGPGAIRHATEAVMGSVLAGVSPEDPPPWWRSQAVRRAFVVINMVWAVFSSGPAAENSLEAWESLLQLNSGVERTASDPGVGDGSPPEAKPEAGDPDEDGEGSPSVAAPPS